MKLANFANNSCSVFYINLALFITVKLAAFSASIRGNKRSQGRRYTRRSPTSRRNDARRLQFDDALLPRTRESNERQKSLRARSHNRR